MMDKEKRYKRAFLAALIGTAVVVVCCFTPVLVILLGIIGLSAITPYLDYVLFSALLVLVILTIVSYRRWKSCCGKEWQGDRQNGRP